MPNKVASKKRQKGGLVPTGQTLRAAAARRAAIQRIQDEDRFNNQFPEPPVQENNGSMENFQRRLAALRLATLRDPQDEPPQNLSHQRRHSVGGIKKRRPRRHKKQTKSRKKSKNNKKSKQKGKSRRKHKETKGKRRH